MADQGLNSVIEVNKLPAYCPSPTMPQWSSHPKVVMAFDAQGNAKCPYCGTQYHSTVQGTHH